MAVEPGEHIPVLLDEVLDNLVRTANGTYVDATFGRGGHSRAMLDRLAAGARLLGLDRDPQAVAAGDRLAAEDDRFTMHAAPFGDMARILARNEVECVDGVLLDLGVSSPQLDDASRGFSYMHDGPLDMRMDPDSGPSAAAWLNTAEADSIQQVLRVHGEERFARRIAQSIVKHRPLHTTAELARIVEGCVPAATWHKSASRTFQAIRIHINAEDEQLKAGLQAGFELLCPGGRMAAISFHSLEDRVVKQCFKKWSSPAELPRRLPVRHAPEAPARLVTAALKPSTQEIQRNPRARSATLRVIEKRPEASV